MGAISEEAAQQVKDILEERGVNSACPRCGRKDFAVVVEGYLENFLLPPDLRGTAVAQSSNIPSVALLCKNCGFISQHALGVLGLLPRRNTK